MEEIGQKALSTILKKQKNIDVFNKYLLSCSNGEIEYKNNLYQLCHELKKGDREHREERECIEDRERIERIEWIESG